MIVTAKQAYEWVKTGHWDLKEFEAWVTASRTDVDNAYSEGYSEGYADGQADADNDRSEE